MKGFLKIILAAVVVLLGVALWFWQRGSFSKEVVRLEILAPDTAAFGQEVEYVVKIKNNAQVNLEDAKLIFELPEFSFFSGESQGAGNTKVLNLEVIYPGQERTLTFLTRLFGQQGDKKTAKAFFRYRPSQLKAFFESETTKTTLVDQVPFNLEIDIPSKVNAGREITFSINYFSNIDYPLVDLRVTAEYPSGFEFISSKPASLSKNEWKAGLLNKAEGGRINLTGKFTGQAGSERILKVKAGLWLENQFIPLKESLKGITLISPRLFVTQEINSDPLYVAKAGDLLHYEIFFKNIGQEPLTDLFLVAKLEGKGFDFATFKSEQGKFTPGDNSIVFDGRTVPKLQFLDAQDQGSVEFWIELKDDWSLQSPSEKNQALKNTVLIAQSREEFTTKINSKVELSQKGFFNDEVFGNSGPLPPNTTSPTTYTILWQLKNFYNDLSSVKVKAVLPPYVRLTGKVFEDQAKLTFDSVSRELVWEIGQVSAAAGVLQPGPTLAFQVELKSGQEHIGSFPALISEAVVTGEDDWTGQQLSASSSALDTRLLQGENLPEEKSKVSQ